MHINSCSKLIPLPQGVSPDIDTPGGQMLCFMQNIHFFTKQCANLTSKS